MTDDVEKRAREIVEELRADIDFELDDVIANIVRELPEDYFKSLSRHEQLKHLKALLAMGFCDLDEEIRLRSEDGRHIAVVSRQNFPGLLANILKRLPAHPKLVGARVFTSTAHNFIIDLFEFESKHNDVENSAIQNQELEEIIVRVSELSRKPAAQVKDFMSHYHPTSQLLTSPEQITEHFLAFLHVEKSNDVAVNWTDTEHSGQTRVTISAGGTRTKDVFQRTAEFLAQHSLDVEQAILQEIPVDEGIPISIASFVVAGKWQQSLTIESASKQLARYLRLDQDVIENTALIAAFPDLDDTELALAVCRLTGHLLKFQGFNITFQQIVNVMIEHRASTTPLLSLLKANSATGAQTQRAADDHSISLEHLNSSVDRMALSTFNAIANSLTCSNFNQKSRRSLALRFEESLFNDFKIDEKPFAVFYIFGKGFDGFHVRFRDVARGGMRLIKTRNLEHYHIESVRCFEEAFRLAAAQQLKNKDIAEGGAKATIVLKPGVDVNRAGRDFVDGLLDLVIQSGDDAGELLYLGPDENVTPELIEWIVDRSRQRGYPYPDSIMSSKPHAGINHKEYGVTSEGVIVFLKRALLNAGYNLAEDSFSVKITGGPDGDVASNAIKILYREFGDRVRIIGIADGTGSATDPAGLSKLELLRLVDQQLPITKFDTKQLSSEGHVGGLESADDVARRNDMQFTPFSDVLIPAGGRPSTINRSNWESYFDENGGASANIIIEGANLFIDDEARKHLSERGVVVIKDSSANKCGVICSSLEIIAGMLLSDSEFLEIKAVFVDEVLGLLRQLAETEAICLFNEHPRCPDKTLPEISVLISQLILRLGDLINDDIEQWQPEDRCLANELVQHYLPDSLVAKLGSNAVKQIPPVYRNQLIAAILASRVVYREGLQNLQNMRQDDLKILVLDHLRLENETRRLIEEVSQASVASAQQIGQILLYSGTKAQRELRSRQR